MAPVNISAVLLTCVLGLCLHAVGERNATGLTCSVHHGYVEGKIGVLQPAYLTLLAGIVLKFTACGSRYIKSTNLMYTAGPSIAVSGYKRF